MFCNRCGSQVADDAAFCTVCGNKLQGAAGGGSVPKKFNVAGVTKAGNNLFSQITANFNPGIQKELGIWILMCVSAVLFFLTCILAGDVIYTAGEKLRTICVFLLLFAIGLCVLTALRLKPVSILFGNITILFIMLIPYYNLEKYIFRWGGISTTAITVLFVFSVLAAMTTVVVCFLQFFSSLNLHFLLMVSEIVTFGLIAAMMLLPCLLSSDVGDLFEHLGEIHFIMGSLAYLILCSAVADYTIFFCRGLIDNSNGKLMQLNFSQGGNAVTMRQAPIGVQCIRGNFQGQAFPVQGEIVIGSQQGSAHIVVHDAYVSKQHCFIRYNAALGNYEVMDVSSNGVFFSDGRRLQKGIYNTCPRGAILCLGSVNQQFRLM